jgi:hypothetical protein
VTTTDTVIGKGSDVARSGAAVGEDDNATAPLVAIGDGERSSPVSSANGAKAAHAKHNLHQVFTKKPIIGAFLLEAPSDILWPARSKPAVSSSLAAAPHRPLFCHFSFQHSPG